MIRYYYYSSNLSDQLLLQMSCVQKAGQYDVQTHTTDALKEVFATHGIRDGFSCGNGPQFYAKSFASII